MKTSFDKVNQTTIIADDAQFTNTVIVTVTDWANHDGVDLSVHRGDFHAALSLTSSEVRMVQAAISAHDIGDHGGDK